MSATTIHIYKRIDYPMTLKRGRNALCLSCQGMTFLVRGLRKPFVDFSSGDYVIPNDISEDLSEGAFQATSPTTSPRTFSGGFIARSCKVDLTLLIREESMSILSR
jgi:hypothetical protein